MPMGADQQGGGKELEILESFASGIETLAGYSSHVYALWPTTSGMDIDMD